jgi:hypothetical protein
VNLTMIVLLQNLATRNNNNVLIHVMALPVVKKDHAELKIISLSATANLVTNHLMVNV